MYWYNSHKGNYRDSTGTYVKYTYTSKKENT